MNDQRPSRQSLKRKLGRQLRICWLSKEPATLMHVQALIVNTLYFR